MHITAMINRINWIVSCDESGYYPQRGRAPLAFDVWPSFKGILIIVVIIEGAYGIVS